MILSRLLNFIIAISLSTSFSGIFTIPYVGVELERTSAAVDEETVQSIGIKNSARAAVVFDSDSEQFLYEKNSQELLPIASLTKLMTAMVFLETNPVWTKTMEILPEDDRIGAKIYIYKGEIVTLRDLFYSVLVGSANNATVALVRSTGLSEEEFVKKMNEKAQELGLTQTKFYDATGLDPQNVSTAKDVARMMRAALGYKKIREALSTVEYEFSTLNTNAHHRIKNTDVLLESFLNQSPYTILGGKTGYLDEALYCFAVGVRDKNGKNIIVVTLGTPSSDERFLQAKGLIYWALNKIKI